MTFSRRLKKDELEFLVELSGRLRPGLKTKLTYLDTDSYPYKDKLEVKQMLLDELVKRGLDADDEPNEYGEVLEGISDKFLLDA